MQFFISHLYNIYMQIKNYINLEIKRKFVYKHIFTNLVKKK